MTSTKATPGALDRFDPQGFDLDAVRAHLATSPRADRLQPIGMRRIELGGDVLATLPDAVRSVARPGPVRVLMDTTPMTRDGRDLKALVLEMLAPVAATPVVLGTPGHELHADVAATDAATAALAGSGCVVAVGSGTICDIGKKATEGPDPIPYVVVQTACSVNAFSDDQAVLLLRGAKRTVPSRWPDVLLVDLSVIADAPSALNEAGVGELTAMFTAPADWLLASQLGLDDRHDDVLVDLFRRDGERLEVIAPGVAVRDPEALRWLCERMTLSGLALGAAGRTAPISGAEHAISHLLDMAAARTGVRTGLHGAQVGVAAVVVAALWQDILERFDPELLLREPPSAEAAHGRIERAFADLDPTGEMAAECWRLYQRKLSAWTAGASARRAFVAAWPGHRARLSGDLLPPDRIAAALAAAGAPRRFSELDPPADADTARWALGSAHLLRDRFGVLDLVDLGGAWGDAEIDRVLDRAAAAGGGL